METIAELKLNLLIASLKPDYLFLIFPNMNYRYDVNYAMESIDVILPNFDDAVRVKKYFEERKYRVESSAHERVGEPDNYYYVVRITLPEFLPVELSPSNVK